MRHHRQPHSETPVHGVTAGGENSPATDSLADQGQTSAHSKDAEPCADSLVSSAYEPDLAACAGTTAHITAMNLDLASLDRLTPAAHVVVVMMRVNHIRCCIDHCVSMWQHLKAVCRLECVMGCAAGGIMVYPGSGACGAQVAGTDNRSPDPPARMAISPDSQPVAPAAPDNRAAFSAGTSAFDPCFTDLSPAADAQCRPCLDI